MERHCTVTAPGSLWTGFAPRGGETPVKGRSGRHTAMEGTKETDRQAMSGKAWQAARPGPGGAGDGRPRGRSPRWRRAAPFLAAAGIMAWLFLHIDRAAFLAAVESADVSLFVPWLLAFVLATFVLDAQNLAAVLRELGHPMSFRSLVGIRGGTYLLMTLDHTLGLGALAWCLQRELSIPALRVAGLMLFFNTITQFTLVAMTIAGLALITPATPLLRYFLVACIVFAGAVVLFVGAGKTLASRGQGTGIWSSSLLRVFHEASWKGYCSLVFWRVVYYVPFIVFFSVGARAFHMNIPMIALTAYVPIILLVISMPVTPGGFGTAQAAMIYLFGGYGSDGNIMAFGLAYSTSVLLLRSLIGLMFASSVSGHPRQPLSDERRPGGDTHPGRATDQLS
jgi:uncharacterized membrane protein YbhN (UPF0104 family)